MPTGHGFKAQYDYVELLVEQHGDRWCITLLDHRHLEDRVHDEEFDTSAEARDAALTLAQHHINIQHNDTLLLKTQLSWQEY
jgi:hypothetical protein